MSGAGQSTSTNGASETPIAQPSNSVRLEVTPELATVFAAIAQAPDVSRVDHLAIIQNHGEYVWSRFPSKHQLCFNFGEGLALRGYSDTWVSPASVSVVVTLNNKPVSAEFVRAFSEQTGRDFYECAISEAYRRLDVGDVTRTERQELEAALKDMQTETGRQKALDLISRTVDAAEATQLKGTDPHYNRLIGRGFILDLKDGDHPPPFSNLHENTRLSIGVSNRASGPIIEIGHRHPLSGAFETIATFDGAPAERLWASVDFRIKSLTTRLTAERDEIQSNLASAVENGPMQDWRATWFGDRLEVSGTIGHFKVTFSADAKARFEGISALVNPNVQIHSQAGPYLLTATPPSASVAEALNKILESRADLGAVLANRFSQDSLVAKNLLARVAAHLAEAAENPVREFTRGWHAHRFSLLDARWQVSTGGDAFNRESVLVSPSGVSVGCWSGGISGGYSEAFKFDSPEALQIAREATERLETLDTATV